MSWCRCASSRSSLGFQSLRRAPQSQFKDIPPFGHTIVLYRDNGEENGNYRDYRGFIGITVYILRLYRDNGEENGNYRDYSVYFEVI